MSYATQAQLVDRFGEQMLVRLTDRGEVATGAIDAAVVTRALADTDALIDGYLAVRYTLPLTATPALVVDLALAIAIWKLHVYQPDAKIEADCKAALATLRDLSRGDVRLDVAGAEPATGDGGGAVVTDRDRPFTADNMTGFI